jgi:hypothetical protein
VLGATGLAFARGVIVCLALNDASQSAGFVAACRRARARFPGLLAGSLVYSAFVTFGAVGINVMLRDADFDLNYVGRRDVTVPAKTMALRTLDAFVPGPGSPFAEFVPFLRHSSFRRVPRSTDSTNSSDYWRYVSDQVQAPFVPTPTPVEEGGSPVLAVSLASLGALLLAESMLRFTPIMAMNSRGRRRLGAITPVLRSVWLGIRHFGVITKHVWLLRLAFVAGYGIFFMLPVVMSQDVVPPVMTSTWKSATESWSASLTLMCYWLVMALFTAFSAVYDARLYAALEEPQPTPA